MGERLNRIRRKFEPMLRRIFHAWFLLVRGMTLGVRAVVLDADNRVFLVRHSYIAGWYLPGGGVDLGESMEQAMRRELKEEGDIDLTGDAVLHGIFLNSHVSRRDHVAVYVVRHFRQDRLPAPNHEIVECGFFAINALPEGTTDGTRQRLAEVLDGRPLIATWR
ncbi:NUDIX hydrolase [Bradyrhizobium sacchari]|uniref:ADP-ribose pyrophosphatase YjhB (NUDIX family) n=1 Tax=Bradyrhizobium sacchari TaxID=1399419 RepID=A0A560JHB3_9BRAD|nr:NUDIX domain-containing protein [Bradyrhizobium sacchari]OPY96749.1 NUDIX hydrolase [Bradyrhizobium sacchari]TWB48363.1 ADP-ribose pyrophosphatase YjhB (NUDIX family) [Bradyrhizobium sacchari]TWB67740.1 ADP-ribose pyrophosphatase YjhB (NUDIX family) [Bradyrhizobium sacchari]